MKILRVVSDIYPNAVGGLPIHAHELSRAQAELGHDVTVFTTRTCSPPNIKVNPNYHIVYFNPVMKIYGNSLLPALPVALFKYKKKYDIIHAHSHLFLSTNYCALIRKLGSSPLVVTNHGIRSQSVPEWINNIYMPTAGRLTFRSADKVLCYTKEEKSLLEKMGVKGENIAVIHNGINADLFVPSNEDIDKKYVLWIGRFVPGKGVEYLVDAFAQVKKVRPDLKLVMIGNGPLRSQIEYKIRSLGVNDSVSIRNNVINNELPKIYRKAQVFVLPSIEEGLPRTILEAMACRVPIVCTRLPQLVDIVKDAGILVPVRDSEALAEAILRVITNGELSDKLGISGRNIVTSNYSWQSTVKKTLEIYEDLLTG